MQVDTTISHLGFYAGLNIIWAITRKGDETQERVGDIADGMGQAWYADTADWSETIFEPLDTMLSTMSESSEVPHDTTITSETFLGLADYVKDTSEWLQKNQKSFQEFKDGLFQAISAIRVVCPEIPGFLDIKDTPKLTEEQEAFATLYSKFGL